MSENDGDIGALILDTIKMNLFLKFRTGNYFVDTLITTMFIGIVTFLFQSLINPRRSFITLLPMQETIDYWNSTNRIIIEGRSTIKSNYFTTRSEQLFSNRFRAIWYHINKDLNTNPYIQSIKEYANNMRVVDEENDDDVVNEKTEFKKHDIYVVSQRRRFKLGDNIWCKVTSIDESHENGAKSTCKIEVISINIYTNKLSLNELQNFVDKITEDYLQNIYNCRWNKTFIYTLDKCSSTNDDGPRLSDWNECLFTSSRSFDNLFFDDKSNLIKKIKFFENNKEWYDKEGHPYTLGLGLYGPPGTGKTSVIKCIANLMKCDLAQSFYYI